VVIGALGFPTDGWLGDLPLIIAFLVLAAFTYTSGLRAPAMIAIVKDLLIYITIGVAIIVIPAKLGGFGHIFASVPPAKLLLKAPDTASLNGYSAYATLAIGSALALFLYPHSVTAILSSSSSNAIRRNMAMLPAYSLVLGLLALLGYMALASGVKDMPEYAPYFKVFGPNFAVPALFLHFFPPWFVGVAFAAIAAAFLAGSVGIFAASMPCTRTGTSGPLDNSTVTRSPRPSTARPSTSNPGPTLPIDPVANTVAFTASAPRR